MDEHVRRLNAEVATVRPVGRPRSHQQLVPRARSRRTEPLHGEERRDLLAARVSAGVQEYPSMRRQRPRYERVYRDVRLRPRARRVRARHALVSRARITGRQTRPTSLRVLGASASAVAQAALRASRATWKVIAADMPLGLVVSDDSRPPNGQGWRRSPKGRAGARAGFRDCRPAAILKENASSMWSWLTADVHYTAAHLYDPEPRAVHGLHAVLGVRLRAPERGGLRADQLDGTFWRTLRVRSRAAGEGHLPSSGIPALRAGRHRLRFGSDEVDLCDASGKSLHARQLPPA